MDLLEFYNPLYFVIDCKVRDVGDYLKSYVLIENFSFFFDHFFFEKK